MHYLLIVAHHVTFTADCISAGLDHGVPSATAYSTLTIRWHVLQALQSQQGLYSLGPGSSPAKQQPEAHTLQGQESAEGQQVHLEPVSSSEPPALTMQAAQSSSAAMIQDVTQHHASSTSTTLPSIGSSTRAEQPQGFSGEQSPLCTRRGVKLRCIGTPEVCEGHRRGRMLICNRVGRHLLNADRERHVRLLFNCRDVLHCNGGV